MEFSHYYWAICDNCDGEGKVGHEAFANGITASEWNEWDREDRQNYMDGRYDVTCSACKGRGSVKLPDVSRMSFAEKRKLVELRINARIENELKRERAYERSIGA